jgi:hypothetical protein
MRQIMLAAAAACLVAGCSLTPAQTTAALQIGCAVDGVVQPLAAPLVASLGAAGLTAASADTLLVHPAVVAACATLGGTPAVVVTPAPAANPTATGPTAPAAATMAPTAAVQ